MSSYVNIIQKEISVLTASGHKWISIDEIVLLEASGKETEVSLIDGQSIKVRHLLKWFEEQLPVDLFVRCHRSFIINIELAEGSSCNYVQMKDGHQVPRGRKYRGICP
ncbi:MAG: LytTR family transcriptional regulator DNA-binding domain-containing protein [Bacteroidales bacterium]|jgi:DNA-binding LytR/AlgR family response regulator|nr:LytTR family transcriptional regulator DNA-binding domain-containing protein [Bacteroidales bacterium]